MSLFGTSPDEPAGENAPKSRVALFDEATPSDSRSKPLLFADEDNMPDTSPWGMPTLKRSSRGELIKSLLSTSDIPDNYVDLFDIILTGADNDRGMISPSGVTKVLDAGSLSADNKTKILSILAPDGQISSIGRNEFNVLLALIGLAQEKEEISLDSVDERRRNLPWPRLPGLTAPPAALDSAQQTARSAQQDRTVSKNELPVRSMPKDSTIDPEADPWGNPALHKNHDHDTPQKTNKTSRTEINGFHESAENTNTYTSLAAGSGTSKPNQTTNTQPDGVWGSYSAVGSSGGFNINNPTGSGIGAAGFDGNSGGSDPGRSAPFSNTRAIGGGQVNRGAEEIIQVQLLPEKEGMFPFQHHEYRVISHRTGSKVVRRFSDFVWLLDCLQKRFPFRQLPLLPPKRVGVNGNHLAADRSFMEKRRRGLARFSNALVRHPILSQEQLVIMFLTVPTELAVWRKQATFSIQDEFYNRTLPPGLEDSLPSSLNDLFERSRSGIRKSAEIYIHLCNLLDRLAKRKEGLAADYQRLSVSLQSLTDATHDTYATDPSDVPLLNEGLQSTAKHVSVSQDLLEDESQAWDMGVLEDFKRQRDALVSMRDMFDRRDRHNTDNIPYLERRILANENKLTALRAKSENLVKPGEIEKVAEAIIKDKQSIVTQHARNIFVKECIRDELVYFQQSQFHVSRWNQDWAQERVKYSELQADNWKQLQDELESMPLG